MAIVEEIGTDSGGKYICVSESNYSGRESGKETKRFNYVKYYLSDLDGFISSNGKHSIRMKYLEDNDGFAEEYEGQTVYISPLTFQGYIYCDKKGSIENIDGTRVKNTGVTNIADTTARINATLTPMCDITECGFYYGTSTSNMKKVVESGNVSDCKTIWYDLGTGKWTSALSKGTKYYYQIYIVSGGVTYTSTVDSFITTGDSTAPTISNVKITNKDNSGYTISCQVTDNVGIDKVCFPTWTLLNNQDDLFANWETTTAVYSPSSGSTYTYRVNISSHNNEEGAYATHIYAHDKAGNYVIQELLVDFKKEYPLTGFTLNNTAIELVKNGSANLTVTSYTPSNTTSSKTATWKSSNTAVATVSSAGKVTAVGKGTATITCTIAGVSKTCTVTVKPITYSITYNANGGSGAPTSQTKEQGVNLTLSATKPTRVGYNFLGWSTSSTATSAEYASGASYTKNSAATLYAVWSKIEYSISYSANGGSGAPASQVKKYGETLTLSTTKPTREGYNFVGWSTSSTATSAEYSSGASYTKDSSVTLYAVWKSSNSINGIIMADNGRYYYYVDSTVDTTKDGLLYYEPWEKWVYCEVGEWIATKYDLVKYEGADFFVVNGIWADDISGLQLIGNNFYFLAYGQVQTQYTGLALYDGEWFYIEEGILAINFNGIQNYDGSKFLIAAGRIVSDYTGLYNDSVSGKWYYIVYGQVQTDYTGLVQYDGAWFYLVEGVLASDYTGMVEYDGALFKVVNGQVQ